MRPEDWKAFGGGAGASSLHPVAFAILVSGILLLWCLPRVHMLKPFLALAILLPIEQQAVVFGLHFPVLRILIFCAWIRVAPDFLQRGRLVAGGFSATDKALILWLGWTAIAYAICWGDLRALIPRLGVLYTAAGAYFLLRCLVRDKMSVERTIRTLAVICAVLAVLMTVEQFTGRSLLSTFASHEFTEIREGRIRSQGPFAHPIIAGVFGALLLPVFLGLRSSAKSRKYALIGICGAAVMVATSASSTPVAAAVVGVAGVFMWPLRRHMRTIRWGALATLIALHIVMKAPVWSLLHRVSFVGGSNTWHRFELVDQCIRHFDQWWLVGTTVNDAWGAHMWDTANWYVGSAVRGGLIGLGLFIALISFSFRDVGRGWRSLSRESGAGKLVWSLGAGMFAGAVSFLGSELYDQSVVAWYALPALTLAAIRSAARPATMMDLDVADRSVFASQSANEPAGDCHV